MISSADKLYATALESELPTIAQEVVATRPFQRLFGITHGGLKADPVHNNAFERLTASHNRGNHSVSVARLANHLYNPNELEVDRIHFVLSALLHDLGHSAFSHFGELAFENLCHKEFTEDLILNDPELVAIWQKHGIDPGTILKIALEKTHGNPMTVKRDSGIISLDHLNNCLFDNFQRGGDLRAKKLAQKLLRHTFIKRGIIYLQPGQERLQTAFIRASIKQNTNLVFGPKEMVLEQIGIELARKLHAAGLIEPEDLRQNQPYVTRKILSRDAEDIAPEEIKLLKKTGPALTAQECSGRVSKVLDPKEASRVIDSAYLFSIPIYDQENPDPFTELRKKVTGNYKIVLPYEH
jgi:HD superfamily phosphohydrolase